MTDSLSPPLLQINENGLFCQVGNFYIDPWRSVDFAVITHGHSDHAKAHSRAYLCAKPSASILRIRLGKHINLQTLPYGESITHNGVKISLHPAGHILGSAQVRVEYKGEVWVVTGDYKREPDLTCDPFEPVPCHTLVTESTFGLPIFNWPNPEEVHKDINAWWDYNAIQGKICILFAYSLGKAQRLLSQLDANIGPIHTNPAISAINKAYEAEGVYLPNLDNSSGDALPGSLLIVPPSYLNSRFTESHYINTTAHASGWMALKGMQIQNRSDRGFVLSDHADWKGLLQTVEDCNPEKVLVTHGFVEPLVKYLNETGVQAYALNTPYQAESPILREQNE